MKNKPTATNFGGSEMVILTPARTPPIKLDTLRNIRDEMGRVYREARAGKMDTQDLPRFCFALDKLREVIVALDIEQRIERLEKKT